MNYSEEVRLTAAQWFIDIHEVEDPPAELLHDWMRWMEASESHRMAFSAVERLWRDAGSLKSQHIRSSFDDRVDDYDGSVSVALWQQQRSTHLRAQTVRRGGRRWVTVAAAAVLATIAIIAAMRHQVFFDHPEGSDSFTTRSGEQMQVTLPDGSQVSLGARSRLTVTYTQAERNVHLESGEAFFSVQKDASRPFRVQVLGSLVTAVGTAFDVRATNDRVRVAVSEGTVQVNTSAATLANRISLSLTGRGAVGPMLARVTRGEAISFQSQISEVTAERAVVTHVDPSEPARWRDGWLVYRNEPLRDVLADVARYIDGNLELADSLKIDSRFTGAIYKGSVVEWLQSLPNAFAVQVKIDGKHIRIAGDSATAGTQNP